MNGETFIYHDLIFPEEVTYLAEDQLLENQQIKPEDQIEICSTEPVNIENFVKFFREKYRLCWKEIYLKFSALFKKAERCKNCREWFQVSDIAGCRAAIHEQKTGPEADQNRALEGLQFHELDFEEKELSSGNGFSADIINIY